MEPIKNPKEKHPEKCKRNRHPDRVTLLPETLNVLALSIKAIEGKFTGLRISRQEFVNWLIVTKASKLSHKEFSDLKSRYFDPVEAIKLLAKEAECLKKSGSEMKIREMILKLKSFDNTEAK